MTDRVHRLRGSPLRVSCAEHYNKENGPLKEPNTPSPLYDQSPGVWIVGRQDQSIHCDTL